MYDTVELANTSHPGEKTRENIKVGSDTEKQEGLWNYWTNAALLNLLLLKPIADYTGW